jgi:hypothetical protein
VRPCHGRLSRADRPEWGNRRNLRAYVGAHGQPRARHPLVRSVAGRGCSW